MKKNEKASEEFLGDLDLLPFDCIFLILGYLREIDLIRISSSSKNWSVGLASRSDRIWEEKHERLVIRCSIKDQKPLMKRLNQQKSFYKKYSMLRNLEKSYFERIFPGVRFLRDINSINGVLSLKMLVVGDDGVGKTCLVISYANNSFPDDYVPTVFDNYGATVLFRNYHVNVGIWDSAGGKEYDQLRPLAYDDTNVFIVCFSLDDPSSLESVRNKWAIEIRKYCPNVPIILCGNKLDLREDSQIMCELVTRDFTPVTTGEAEVVAKEIGAVDYRENSAKTKKGLKETFECAISSVLFPKYDDFSYKRDNKKCKIM